MTSKSQEHAKELYLTPTKDSTPRYSLQEIISIVTDKNLSQKGKITISVLEKWSRDRPDPDRYTWEELRAIGRGHQYGPQHAKPGRTWEEVILELKAQFDNIQFGTSYALNMQASMFLQQAKLVPDPKDNPDTFLHADFQEVAAALQILNATRQNIDRIPRR